MQQIRLFVVSRRLDVGLLRHLLTRRCRFISRWDLPHKSNPVPLSRLLLSLPGGNPSTPPSRRPVKHQKCPSAPNHILHNKWAEFFTILTPRTNITLHTHEARIKVVARDGQGTISRRTQAASGAGLRDTRLAVRWEITGDQMERGGFGHVGPFILILASRVLPYMVTEERQAI